MTRHPLFSLDLGEARLPLRSDRQEITFERVAVRPVIKC